MKEQKARREVLAKEFAEKTGRPASELSQLLNLEATASKSVLDGDEFLERTPTELAHNEALEQGIDFQERLEQLINSATKRKDDVLVKLEQYRAGLGRYLRLLSHEIIDVTPNVNGEPETV